METIPADEIIYLFSKPTKANASFLNTAFYFICDQLYSDFIHYRDIQCTIMYNLHKRLLVPKWLF